MNIESKLRPLYLAKILLSQTDDEHSLTTNELSEILEREYHISAHRTTIGEDIKVLAQAGLDVDTIKSTQNKFRILSRDFDIAELKLLIDAVESSKFITEKRSHGRNQSVTEPAKDDIYGAGIPVLDKLKMLAEWAPMLARVQAIVNATTPEERALAVIKALQWASGKSATEIDDEALYHLEAVLKSPEGRAFFNWIVVKIKGAE